MPERTITVEHNGQTYYGHIATIKSTTLGYEDHGILSAWLMCEWPGSGIGVGGYCLDQPKDRDGKDYSRAGTAYGLDHLIRLMETVGVSTWEALRGAKVIVLFDTEHSWGTTAKGIAGLLNDKVLILSEHADEWRSIEAQP